MQNHLNLIQVNEPFQPESEVLDCSNTDLELPQSLQASKSCITETSEEKSTTAVNTEHTSQYNS